jgi:glycosyltransferase involved in cell wall biosynthesis
MVTREFPPLSGGIGYYVYNLAKKLIERGHHVIVVTRGTANKTVRNNVDNIDVFWTTFFPIYPFHLMVHGYFVNRIIKSLSSEITLLHLHSPLPPPIFTRIPIITTVHTPSKVDARHHEIIDFSSLAERLQSGVYYPHVEQKLFALSNLVTSVSYSVSKELQEYGLNPNDVKVVGNGVDEKTFTPITEKNNEKKYVLFTGVLRARKGLFDLIECAAVVCKKRRDVKFVICGDGPFLLQSIEMVRKKNLQDKILFLGRVNRLKLTETYQNATVQVVPSHYEGLPTVMLEGMACGLPVVATNVGGIGETIVHGENGFLVPPHAPLEMSHYVLKLLENAQLREKIGRAARKTIMKSFSWDKIADNILECYESIL